MSRSACLAASLLALVLAGLLAGGAGAHSTARSGPSSVVFDCAGPSATDISDSDFFWYWPCASFLHVSVSPSDDALGYVQSTPYAIDCPHACTRPFAAGTKVTLTAYPSNGASFDSWSGDACAGQGNPCVATVNGDTQVIANFSGVAIPPVTSSPLVTVSSFLGFVFPVGGSSGTGNYSCSFLSCSGTYARGTSVTLTASGLAGPYFYCDSTTGLTQHPSPYTFAATSTRGVSPRPAGGSC